MLRGLPRYFGVFGEKFEGGIVTLVCSARMREVEMMNDDFTLGCIAAVTSAFVALIISFFMVEG